MTPEDRMSPEEKEYLAALSAEEQARFLDSRYLRTTCHELAHAFAARAIGWRVKVINIAPGIGVRGWVDSEPTSSLPRGEWGIDKVTILLAGDHGADLFLDPVLIPDVPGCAAAIENAMQASLDRLPVKEAAWVMFTRDHTPPSRSDREKAELIADEVAGEDRDEFLAACDERARQIVAGCAPLISALTPVALAHPLMTGEELEEHIRAALVADKESDA